MAMDTAQVHRMYRHVLHALPASVLLIWSCPAYLPWEILASIVLAESLVITHPMPFVTLEGSNNCKIIIGALTFKDSKCKGKPKASKEYKNFIGNELLEIHQELSTRTCTQHSHQATVLPAGLNLGGGGTCPLTNSSTSLIF